MPVSKIKGVGKAVKGFGKAMKSKMRKAFVDKPTFPGPNVTNILNRELIKKRKRRGPGYRGQDIIEGPLKMRRDMRTGAQKPGKSAIEIDARIRREALRDYFKDAKMPPEYKKVK
tara:strand:- start:68 stop:412 length:345 start_codon:yes stop_codon:yes gene_type:complete